MITDALLQRGGLVLPGDEDDIDWHTGENHQSAHARAVRVGQHWHHRDEDRGGNVDDRPDERHANRPGQVGSLPAEVGQTGDTEADGEPGGEADVVDQRVDVLRGQVEQRQEAHEDDGGRGREVVHLYHRQNLGHLLLLGASIKEAKVSCTHTTKR